MCLAIPGQIVEFSAEQPMLAKVDVAGVKRNVNVGLLADEPLDVGDWVLIHVGFAMSKIGADLAAEQLRMIKALGEDVQAMEEVRGYSFAGDGSGDSASLRSARFASLNGGSIPHHDNASDVASGSGTSSPTTTGS